MRTSVVPVDVFEAVLIAHFLDGFITARRAAARRTGIEKPGLEAQPHGHELSTPIFRADSPAGCGSIVTPMSRVSVPRSSEDQQVDDGRGVVATTHGRCLRIRLTTSIFRSSILVLAIRCGLDRGRRATNNPTDSHGRSRE